jgi:hypothetical protein
VLNRLERIGVELQLIDVRLVEIGISENKNTDRQAALVERERGELDRARAQVGKVPAESG